MTNPNYQKTHFLLSAADINQLPDDVGIEIAFIGRSNSGKSSVLNQLTQNKQLARKSKTPGRTQLINVFIINDTNRLIDLPGYGFAKVPVEIKYKWERLLDAYLSTRTSLRGLILVMDSRHPMKDLDQNILHWANRCRLPVHILLNKADKLSQLAIKQTLQKVSRDIKEFGNEVSFQEFSALKGTGVNTLRKKLTQWFITT